MAYEDIIFATAGLVNYWKLNESSGTSIADSKGTDTGTIQGGVTLNQTGPPGSAITAALFNGTTGYISTATQIASPGPAAPFTIECLVKTSAAPGNGMPLVAFIAPQTGAPTSFSPQLYASNGGGVSFGMGVSGSVQNLSTSFNINNGAWHHVCAVVASNNNMSVFDSGSLAGSNSNTAQALASFAGYWRVGTGQAATGYSTGGSSQLFFNGTIGHVAIYNVALDRTTIAQHSVAAQNYGPIRTTSPLPAVRAILPYGSGATLTRPTTGQLWPRGNRQ